jgi:multiple sugar transport system permease protein
MALSTTEKTRFRLPTAPIARRGRRWSRYSSFTFYLFVSPWLLGFLGLTLFPLLYALAVSFTDFDGISTHWHWVGWANYSELLTTSDTWYSLSRTLIFTVVSVTLSIAGSLGLALLLNQRLKARGLFRTIFYIPSIVPVVASAIMWKLVFARDNGVLNAILERLNVPAITWLVDPTAFYALIIMTLWGLGGGMVIMLAGLQGVPVELLEAAQIDGAGKLQVLRHVTLPQLSPVIFFQVVTSVIAAFQMVIQPLLLSEAGFSAQVMSGIAVPRSNYLYMVDVYTQFFANQRFGFGSAMLWVFFLIILGITLLIFRSSSFWVYYEVDHDA